MESEKRVRSRPGTQRLNAEVEPWVRLAVDRLRDKWRMASRGDVIERLVGRTDEGKAARGQA